LRIACYARKSNDKKNESIENQFSVIDAYISQQNDFRYAEILHFSDDGFTGVNIRREAFQELLTRVRKREIDVIVVKDLSRLGRNYLDVYKLTDSTESTLDLPAALRAVLNEYYLIEASEKIRKSCEARIRNGEHMGYIGNL